MYRSVNRQQRLWDKWSETKGKDYVKKYVAVPGYSEHHTGLAIDLDLIKDGKLIDENDDLFAEKDIFLTIHNMLAKYGFILRYPNGKENITGYSYEPWHIRYVGSPQIASEIFTKNLTLEEYLILEHNNDIATFKGKNDLVFHDAEQDVVLKNSSK